MSRNKRVSDFLRTNGVLGEIVLGVFAEQNPLQIQMITRREESFGWYLKQASRFIARLAAANGETVFSGGLSQLHFIECARRSFSVDEIVSKKVDVVDLGKLGVGVAVAVFYRLTEIANENMGTTGEYPLRFSTGFRRWFNRQSRTQRREQEREILEHGDELT